MAEPQTDPNTPLSDEYLKAHANDPEVAPFLNSEERRRLTRIRTSAVDAAKAAGQPTMGPPTGKEPVTLGDLKADPMGAGGRALHLLWNDVTDPKLLATAAASYLLPKAVSMAAPRVGGAMEAVGRANLGPELKSLALGHRGEKALNIAQKLRGAMSEAAPTTTPEVVPPSAHTPGAAATPSPSPAPVARPTPPVARTLPPEDPAVAEIVDRMAGGPNKPSPGNGTYRPSARQTFDLKSMTPAEQTQAAKWLAEKVPADVIIQRLKSDRAFTNKFNTPNPEEAAAATKARVAEAAKRRKSGAPDEEP